uniref:Uncharacterized protein n=1 Tax=Acrobeloides nanus TaxID=290746 RepID=A0A914EIY1_9BILA
MENLSLSVTSRTSKENVPLSMATYDPALMAQLATNDDFINDNRPHKPAFMASNDDQAFEPVSVTNKHHQCKTDSTATGSDRDNTRQVPRTSNTEPPKRSRHPPAFNATIKNPRQLRIASLAESNNSRMEGTPIPFEISSTSNIKIEKHRRPLCLPHRAPALDTSTIHSNTRDNTKSPSDSQCLSVTTNSRQNSAMPTKRCYFPHKSFPNPSRPSTRPPEPIQIVSPHSQRQAQSDRSSTSSLAMTNDGNAKLIQPKLDIQAARRLILNSLGLPTKQSPKNVQFDQRLTQPFARRSVAD